MPANSTGAVVTPYYPNDVTGPSEISHAEYNGSCGTNGVRVMTWVVSAGSSSLSASQSDQAFFVAVP